MPSLLRRRAAAVAVVGGLLAAPLLLGGPAAGDPVGDKKAEASRVADQLQALATQAEIYAEQYNDAVLRVGQVDADVRTAQARVAASQKDIAARRREVARFAVGAYTRGGDDNLSLLLGSDGSDLGQREGYLSATIGNRQDLVEALRFAEATNRDRIADLGHARQQAVALRARITEKRRAADATTAQLEAVSARITGELKMLVAAEEARRAAAEAAKAQQQALLVAQQQQQAPPPTAPAPGPQSTGGGGTSPTLPPTTVVPPTGGGGGGGGSVPPPTPHPPPPIKPPPPVGVGAGAAIAAARSQLGVRYTWGGASPSTGFDCSGLVMWSWAHGGKSLPHSSAAMYAMSRKIPMSQLQPGDLVFYGTPVHHVALYIGGGSIIHAPSRGDVVKVSSVYYWSDLVGAGRV